MTSPARSTRTLEDRARFGLGSDTQDDNTEPADTEVPNTAEGVIEATTSVGFPASQISVADVGALTAFADTESVLAELLGSKPTADGLTAAETYTSNIVPAATNLGVAVRSSSLYVVRAVLFVTATTNGGVEISWTAPAAATFVWQADIFQAAGNVVNSGVLAVGGALNYIAAALSFDRIEINGLLTTSAAAGAFTMNATQDTSSVDTTTIHIGSSLVITPTG